MLWLSFCLSLLALTAGNPILRRSINPFTPNGRIVGGEEITIEQVPYQVSIQAGNSGYCGGSIIASEWILTAAHCAIFPLEYTTVRVGATNTHSEGKVYTVKNIIVHEGYKTNEYGIPLNDIALFHISEAIELNKLHNSVPLYEVDEETFEGSSAHITGWGTLTEGGSTENTLRSVYIPVISKEVCHEAYIEMGGLPAGQICAAYPQGGKDSCQGDSGGPMVIDGRQAGVVSWGNGCARPNNPGVYTEISFFRNWIREHTGV